MWLAALHALLLQGVPEAELAAEQQLRGAVVSGARWPEATVAQDWRVRARALERIERSARSGRAASAADRSEARAALADPHPNVRARALAALAAAGEGALTSDELARACGEELALVRLALARALEFVAAPGRAAALAQLAFDGDERVRAAARNALFGLEPDEAQLASALETVLARTAAEEDEHAFASLCAGLLLAGLDAPRLALARAAARDEARAGLVEALAFAGGLAGDAQRLTRALVGASDERWDPLAARVMAAAARARSSTLARALCAALPATAEDSLAREACLALACASFPRATAWSELAALALAPELRAELVLRLAPELERCEPAVLAPWLAPASPRVLRASVLAAAAAVFTRTGEAGSEALLVQALSESESESELGARAFEVLASASALRAESDGALAAAFRRRSAEARLASLGWFTRARGFALLRDDWLALGESTRGARAALGELLGALRAEAAVAAALRRWLAQDLAEVEQGAAPARELEQQVQSELRALARHGPEAVADFTRALDVALGRSSEIGKLAVAALGRSAAGRDELARRLARGELAAEADRRTRIEAGIQLASALRGAEGEPALALLLGERENAAWDLRERVLAALASGAEEARLAPLSALLLAPTTPAVERAALATLLAEHFGARAAPALFALLRSGLELEARRSALVAFAAWPAQADELARWLTTVAEAPELPLEERELLLGEGRVALAGAAPAHPALRGWLAAPRARAAADLAARLSGQELAAVQFSARNELELARVLARAGQLAPALAAEGEWWQLDGRLLGELGRAALEGEAPSARALTRAAVVARLGERDADEREVALLLGRLAALAARAGEDDELLWLLPRLLSAQRAGRLDESDVATLAQALFPGARAPEGALAELLAQVRARRGGR